jgi:methanol--5-hydroxybenzimidazolylcobamide Co-methyltransferase
MEFLWREMVAVCARTRLVPSGDTACGFANTAMVLAEQRLIPRVLAAVVRVASVPRSLVAYEMGAVGPSKDCAYEGPYMKAIAGVPISMEGRTAACAHLSPVENIAQGGLRSLVERVGAERAPAQRPGAGRFRGATRL